MVTTPSLEECWGLNVRVLKMCVIVNIHSRYSGHIGCQGDSRHSSFPTDDNRPTPAVFARSKLLSPWDVARGAWPDVGRQEACPWHVPQSLHWHAHTHAHMCTRIHPQGCLVPGSSAFSWTRGDCCDNWFWSVVFASCLFQSTWNILILTGFLPCTVSRNTLYLPVQEMHFLETLLSSKCICFEGFN